jgi:Protein of unknown function (DUF3568)
MELRFIIWLISLGALVVGSSGCVAVAVGAGAAGTVAYLSGDLETAEPYDIDTVFVASKTALAELKLTVLEGRTTKDALAATIVARDAAEKEIVVKLKSTVSGTTTISIRVGTFGSEGKSQQIYDRIRKNLTEKGDRRPDR